MIAPDARVDELPFTLRRTGHLHMRVCEHPVATIQPAVRSPREGVQRLVRVLRGEAFEQHLRLARGFRFIAFLHRDEQKIGTDPT